MIEEEIIANLDNILTALVPGEVSDDNLDDALVAGDDGFRDLKNIDNLMKELVLNCNLGINL